MLYTELESTFKACSVCSGKDDVRYMKSKQFYFSAKSREYMLFKHAPFNTFSCKETSSKSVLQKYSAADLAIRANPGKLCSALLRVKGSVSLALTFQS